jgi:hypothetical protein
MTRLARGAYEASWRPPRSRAYPYVDHADWSHASYGAVGAAQVGEFKPSNETAAAEAAAV